MDEATWLICNDPHVMLEFLRTSGPVSDRKLRLLAVDACRRVWHLTHSERARRAAATAEQYAEGLVLADALDGGAGEPTHSNDMACYEAARLHAATAAAGTLSWAGRAVYNASWNGSPWAMAVAAESLPGGAGPEDDVEDERLYAAAEQAAQAAEAAERAAQAALVRDIFGNPFQPLPSLDAASLARRNGTIRRLAEAVYQERCLPAGTFDQERLGVLADALEEAGADAALVGHLRAAGGVHVHGCHVLDLLLQKE